MRNGLETLLAVVEAKQLCVICNARVHGVQYVCCEKRHCTKCMSILI